MVKEVVLGIEHYMVKEVILGIEDYNYLTNFDAFVNM